MVNRKAFSLIELVFSIVIIGIVSLSLPLLLSNTTKNIQLTMQQEAILTAKTSLGLLLSYDWDPNVVYEDPLGVADDKILVLGVADNQIGTRPYVVGTASDIQRIGHVNATANRRQMYYDGVAIISASGPEAELPMDTETLTVNAADLDYVTELTIEKDAVYIDTPDPAIYAGRDITINNGKGVFPSVTDGGVSGPSTDIKRITTTVKDDTLDIDVTLSVFTSNIGLMSLKEKDY